MGSPVYGKLFKQMYKGTLASTGPWEALVTFQQLIILADRDGVVDMTPDAISRETTIPRKIIDKGLETLEQTDPDSRTPDCDGRRIIRLSDTRTWGWRITNYEYYRKLRSEEERREYQRQYWHKRRGNVEPQQDSTNSIHAVSSMQYAESNKKERERDSDSLSVRIPECPEDMDAESEYGAAIAYHSGKRQPITAARWRSWVLGAVESGKYVRRKKKPPTQAEIAAEYRKIAERQAKELD